MGREDNLVVRPIEGKIDLILPSKGNLLSKQTLELNQIPAILPKI